MQIKHYENLVSNYPPTLYESTDPTAPSTLLHGLSPDFFKAPDSDPGHLAFPYSPNLVTDLLQNFCLDGYPELGPGPDLVTYPHWSSSVF